MTITQTITTLPAAPDPATMTRDEFNAAAAAHVLAQKAMVPEINTWAEQVNAIAATAVGDVATAIGAAGADTPVGADKFTFRKAADGLLKSVTLDALRSLLATFTGLVNLASGANIASAATIDLTAATGNTVTITGTTSTSAFTMNDGQHMTLVSDAAWPITYHATTAKVVGGGSFTCAAGDIVHAFKTGGVVYVEPPYAAQRSTVILATRDLSLASGDVAYTGFGGRPKSIEVLACHNTSTNNSGSEGYATSADQAVRYRSSVGVWAQFSGLSGVISTGVGAQQTCALATFDADGVTLTWAKTGSPTGTGNLLIIARF